MNQQSVAPVRPAARANQPYMDSTPTNEPSWVEINLTRLDHNVAALRAVLDQSAATQGESSSQGKKKLLCAVVKADAYGLGAATIAQRLVAKGVDMLAVYAASQAADLLRASGNCPILVLSPMRQLTRTDPLYRAAVTGRLHLTVHDLPQIDEILRIGTTFGCTLPVHLHVDTGMSRSGLSEEELPKALDYISRHRHVKIAGLYTHLASAQADDGSALSQLEHFDKLIAEHRAMIPADAIVHIANTFATSRDRRFHRDMVRAGLGLYGYGPDLLEGGNVISEMEALTPIVRWRSRINHVQKYPAGARVGYDSTFTCERQSVLGVIPAGYADGYPYALSGKSVVSLPQIMVQGKPATAPLRGKVNMDQIVIDLTDIPDAKVGSLVDLISSDPASPCALPKLAKQANSHCYEMLTRLSPRIARHTIYNEDKLTSQG